MSLKDQLENETRDVRNSGIYFKFQEGDNRIRVLSEGAVVATHFFGKGVPASVCYGISKGCPFHDEKAPKDEKGQPKNASIRYRCYVLDRVDEQIKQVDLPYSVVQKISALQEDPEWAFEFPMPYNIKVTYKPDESPTNMYSVIGSPKREELRDEIGSKLADLLSSANPVKLVQDQKDRQMLLHKEQGIWLENKSTLTEDEKKRITQLKDTERQKRSEIDISGDEIPF